MKIGFGGVTVVSESCCYCAAPSNHEGDLGRLTSD